jgi:hypothetical protein
MSLVTCSGCQRHVKRDETACPFCGHELAATEPRRAAGPVLSRTAAIFAGATAIAACGKEPQPPPPPTPAPNTDQTQMPAPAYGPPPQMMSAEPVAPTVPDAGKPGPGPGDAGKQTPLSAPAYGPPPRKQ